MSYTKSILFDFVSQGLTNGTIQSSITDVTPINSRNVYYEVVGPLYTVRVPDFNTPDGVLDIGTPTAAMPNVNVPLNSDGTYQEGSYIIRFYVEDQANLGVYDIVETSGFVLDILKQGDTSCRLQTTIGFEVNCYCYNIKVTDETNYAAKGATLISRQMDIILPTIPPATVPPTPIQTTDPTVTFTFGYTNVSYTVNLYPIYESYDIPNNVTVREDLPSTLTQKVKCDFNLCALLKCINEKLCAIEKKAKEFGGESRLPQQDLDTVLLINQYLNMLEAFRACGDFYMMDKYYKKLQALLHCDCGCADGNTDTPTAVNPACDGNNPSAILSVIGNAPILVSVVAQTAIISIDPIWLANLNNTLNGLLSDITTTTPTYIGITTPSSGVRQVDFLGVWTSYTTLTNAVAFAGVYDFDTTPVPLRYRTNTAQNFMQFDGTFKKLITSGITCLTQNALGFTITRQGAKLPAFNNSGVNVGTFELLIGIPSSTTHLVFTPNANYVIGAVVYVNGLIPIN
jgi:hypothetical protein